MEYRPEIAKSLQCCKLCGLRCWRPIAESSQHSSEIAESQSVQSLRLKVLAPEKRDFKKISNRILTCQIKGGGQHRLERSDASSKKFTSKFAHSVRGSILQLAQVRAFAKLRPTRLRGLRTTQKHSTIIGSRRAGPVHTNIFLHMGISRVCLASLTRAVWFSSRSRAT